MRNDPTPYLDTAWTLQVLRAVLIYLVEFMAAPLWCSFFHVPEATTAMRVLGLGQLILGFHSISTPVLMRNLQFDRLFFNYVSEAIAYAGFTIGAAFWLRNAWAPVVGILGSYLARVITSYLVAPVRAWFRFQWAKAREMIKFTKWITAHVAADFLLETTDNAVVGRVLGKVSLAQYRMAYQLATEGPLSLQWTVSRVAFPAFSAIQDDLPRVHGSFRVMMGLVSLVMMPICIGGVILGPILIPLLLGPSWTPSIAPLQILLVAALMRSILETAPPLLRGLGFTRQDFILKGVQLLMMCTLLVPSARRTGIVGVSWAVVIAAAVALPVWIYILRSTLRLRWADLVRPIISPTLAAIAGGCVLLILPPTGLRWISLVSYGLIFLGVYAIVILGLRRVLSGSGLSAVLSESKQ
jgi:O-antigen/teichoic acid export membrane protein